MEAKLKIQKDLLLRITNAFTNFKKSPKERITISYLETRSETLEKLWEKFTSNHEYIISNLVEGELQKSSYDLDGDYDNAEEKYTDYKAELKSHLRRLESSKSQVKVDSKTVSNTSIKLPKITIPTFSGNYNEWPTFRDLFVSLVHSNESLDDVQKLHYLKGYLTGEAEQLIRQVPITSANYKQCWDQIEKRFNNKRHLCNCILKRLFSQYSLKTESSAGLKDLLDNTNECLHALKNLGVDISNWDIIVIYIVTLKLDTESRKLWEVKVSELSDVLPKLDDFREFLEHRFRSLEFLDTKTVKSVTKNVKTLHVATPSCVFCSEFHKLCNCKTFANQDVDTRRNFVKASKLCFNCLGDNHGVYSCRQSTRCQICHKKHHSLLHPKGIHKSVDSGKPTDDLVKPSTTSNAQGETAKVISCFSDIQSQSLLATALIEVEARSGAAIVLRALLDQGSQASFITESAVQLLGLRKVPIKADISRLGDEESGALPSKAMVNVKFHSRLNHSIEVLTTAYVLNKLTSLLPERKIIHVPLTLSATELADPSYGVPNKIDMILGTAVYSQILLEGLIRGPPGTPVAQQTTLGWILSGSIHGPNHSVSEKCHNAIVSLHVQINHDDDNNQLLKRFWEMESDSSQRRKYLTDEEERCEKIFSDTTTRDPSGRYIVKLPFKSEDPQCRYGGSENIARQRLNALESKFSRNPELRKEYSRVIKEYLDLGHMEHIPNNEITKPGVVYLPHHAVIRNDKTTTKLRVVFDASCAGYNGVSLNDDLLVGPTLQHDLRHIVMRWRRHPISLVADIIKMYRQVKVYTEDTEYQRLLWRDSPDTDIKHLRLLRLTFGTSSAPYLAVKALQQVAHDEGSKFPLMSERVLHDFYLDDLMTGCESIPEGIEIYNSMNKMLESGGFQLQKWSSNSNELLEEIQEGNEEIRDTVDIKTDEVLKILGLTWIRGTDEFQYTVSLPPMQSPVTKRKVISDIAKLYDPLGWIAPVIITAKILIRKIWLVGISWDTELPCHLFHEWKNFRCRLSELTNFRIPRWLGCYRETTLELQGFCDASDEAYAAVVYARVIHKDGSVQVNLVSSKTKVCPVKQVSIPRLELCGAVLLVRLLSEIADTLRVAKENVHAWTDSSVVLAWLRSHPSRWKPFVANRVSEILTFTESHQWSHVLSSDNPADCASRGILPSELGDLKLWKSGPKWLKEREINYNKGKIKETNLEERKIKISSNVLTCNSEDILSKFSSLTKLTRVVAYCRRFLRLKSENKHKTIWLKTCEINEALLTCVRLCQNQSFKEDKDSLQKLGRVKNKSKLTSLNPYLDKDGILRVGGRLRHSGISDAMKNPILIPHKSPFTDILIAHAHARTLHGGPQLMLNYLRTKYWVINAKGLVRQMARKCVICIRHSAQTNQQLMGQLPEARATACRPFSRSGVDYAGPIAVRPTRGRGYRSTKGYICLFVCMATRAIHLEVVSDMTSQAFLAAFKRFTARRGHCIDLWSDNGTTFVGADRELQNLFTQERSGIATDIADWLGNNGTNWHFIPPYSPNFGGLWESGVKSTKHHLKRVIGTHTLTFEEMTTVLAQIEACLNSRPLSQISPNPDDPFPLTPGHFLVGEPLVLAPDGNFENSNISSLKRWHLSQRLVQEFWRRWSHEYLTQFYHRYKWSNQTPEPNVGDIVLVKEDDLPPARWLYGIITEKHYGLDNLTRVVSLRCKNAIIKRPVSKLIILPIEKS